jgi:phosphate transport system permease protein
MGLLSIPGDEKDGRMEKHPLMRNCAAGPELAKRIRPGELVIQTALTFCATVSILTTLGIVAVLGKESLRFFLSGEVNIIEFLTATKWQPAIGEFGILPLATATLVTSVIAMAIAGPIGLAIAVYLSEYAPARVRLFLKPVLEILAGVPTVVYGYFALTFVTPILRSVLGKDVVNVYNMASAGIVMGVLILPLVSSMCEDALSSIPRALKEGAYALGATRLETTVSVVIPAAFSGIAAAFVLGLSRAVGETMIVALAAGAGPAFTINPLRAAETMTGHIVRISSGDLSFNTIDYNSIFAIGLMLFLITLVLNIFNRWIVKRFREVYE